MLWESAGLPSDIHTKRTQTDYTNNQSSSQEKLCMGEYHQPWAVWERSFGFQG